MHSGAIRRILKIKKKKLIRKDIDGWKKNSLNDKILEMKVAISQKKSWVSMYCWNLLIINYS